MEDKELIYKIQHGNKELLEILIEKYYDDIYRFLMKLTIYNFYLAEELTQETFYRVYLGISEASPKVIYHGGNIMMQNKLREEYGYEI